MKLVHVNEPRLEFFEGSHVCPRDTLQNLQPARLARGERMRDDGGHDTDDLRP